MGPSLPGDTVLCAHLALIVLTVPDTNIPKARRRSEGVMGDVGEPKNRVRGDKIYDRERERRERSEEDSKLGVKTRR